MKNLGPLAKLLILSLTLLSVGIVAIDPKTIEVFAQGSLPDGASSNSTSVITNGNSPPIAGRIIALDDEASKTTSYVVEASDPDGDIITFSWTNSTRCGIFEAEGNRATWNHGSPSCPDEAFHPGTFIVTMTDSEGNEVTRVYNGGSASGEGQLPTIEPSLDSPIPTEITSSPEIILLAVGAIIFLGVGGEKFFKKTGIPDIAFLMMFGIILGPVLGVVATSTAVAVVPYFAALALIIIMFDGGLNLDIRSVITTARFSVVLAVLGFLASMAVTAIIAFLALGWSWFDGLLLGAMVGGSSSIVVFGLVRRLKIADETKSMLSLESAITDILATVVVFVLIEALVLGQELDAGMVGIFTLRSILTGLLLGFGVGIPWIFVYSKMSNAAHVSMLTLGMLFILFFLARSLGESGALTCLVFGLMLGNRQFFAKKLRLKRIAKVVMLPAVDPFYERITFLVRSFFFVFVGLLASFGQLEFIIVGVGIAVALFVSRIGVARITVTAKKFLPFDRLVTAFMMPRGLAAAVLATLPLSLGLPNSSAYPQVVFMIILTSVVITTIGLFKYSKQAEVATPAATSPPTSEM